MERKGESGLNFLSVMDVNSIMNRARTLKQVSGVSLLKWSLVFFIGVYGSYLFLKVIIAAIFIHLISTF